MNSKFEFIDTPVSIRMEKVFSEIDLPSMAQIEHVMIAIALYRADGVIEKAARNLGVDRKTIYRKIREPGSLIRLK